MHNITINYQHYVTIAHSLNVQWQLFIQLYAYASTT